MVAASGRREEAEGRGAAAEVVLTTTGAFGAPSQGAAEAKRAADFDAGEAAGEERRARDRLVQAKEALDVAKKRK